MNAMSFTRAYYLVSFNQRDEIMGREKEKLEQVNSAWIAKAQAKDTRCSVCGELIIYDERDVYFRTGMCGYHTHHSEKDD